MLSSLRISTGSERDVRQGPRGHGPSQALLHVQMDHAGILSLLHVTHIHVHRVSQGCTAIYVFAGPVKKIRQKLFGKEFKKSANCADYHDNGTKKQPIMYSVNYFFKSPNKGAYRDQQAKKSQSERYVFMYLWPTYVLHCT